MIFGEYPCCGGALTLSLPEGADLPAIAPEDCPHCSAKVWHKFSRWDPESWTDEEFRKAYDVNEADKSVSPRYAREALVLPPGLQRLMDERMDLAIGEAALEMEHMLLHGKQPPTPKPD